MWPSRIFRTALNGIKAWRARERAFAELSALDDRTLADLGLQRGELPYVVFGHAHDQAAIALTPRIPVNRKRNGLRAA